jgi:hypothetical protein
VQVTGSFGYFECGTGTLCGTVAKRAESGAELELVAHPVGFGHDDIRLGLHGGDAAAAAASVPGGEATLAVTFDSTGRACVTAQWNSTDTDSGTDSNLDRNKHDAHHGVSVSITVSECAAIVAAAAAAHDAQLVDQYGAVGTPTRDSVDAIRSVVGWNTMYVPAPQHCALTH